METAIVAKRHGPGGTAGPAESPYSPYRLLAIGTGDGGYLGDDLAVDHIVPSALDPRVAPAVAAAVGAASQVG